MRAARGLRRRATGGVVRRRRARALLPFVSQSTERQPKEDWLAGRRARYLERYSSTRSLRATGDVPIRCLVARGHGWCARRRAGTDLVWSPTQTKMQWCGARRSSELVARSNRRSRPPRRLGRQELLLANLEVDRVLGPPPRDDEGRLLLGRPPCHGRRRLPRFLR